jgi:hypothetical protein
VFDWLLCTAYRFAPEPLAQRISETISSRRQARRWNDAVKAHLAAGGMVITHKTAAGEQTVLVGGAA